ncbi:Flp family type IVb pilin [Neobacillus sp. PS3-12]|uniref:Flp family type IVb pilin n=1 Tax=Neobacillus sp. PS3-12 TaxID=3070677 RepID=UPI0027DEBC77|nr:Flp family type IVb pilin [Neobacillus sp. PS3-12]WML51536.1 Flp family type IVb pilin [Neobacillus sp. PS3-12]
MLKKIKALFVEEEGQGMTEYGLILGLVAVGAIAALILLRDKIKGIFDSITGQQITG